MLARLKWDEASSDEKALLIRSVWTHKTSLSKMARQISRLCGEHVTAQAVSSVYYRSRHGLKDTHPITKPLRKVTPRLFAVQTNEPHMQPVAVTVVGFSKAEAIAYDDTARGCSLVELERGQCKWPVEHNYFCGHETDSGDCYCPHHTARSRASRAA